jgi:hypothetical protein
VERQVTPRGWWAVDLLCRLLERDERAAVCGDLVETHASSARALIEVGGLVIRRQASPWLGWRPWLGLLAIVLPLGFLLSVSSRWFADSIAAHLWLYVRLGEWSYLTIPGWRRDVIEAVTTALAGFAALAVWSWTAGYALARVARRAWFVLALALVLMIVFGTTGSSTTARVNYDQSVGPWFSRFFFTPRLFTPILRAFLVIIPAWWGLRRGSVRATLRPTRAVAIAIGTIALTVLISKALEGSLTYGWVVPPQPGPDGIFGTEDDLRPLWWISLVMLWPAVYVLASARRARSG